MDNLPDNFFHLGNNIFAYVSSFNQRLYVHIRQFKPYGKKCYPSKVGVTIFMNQWTELMNEKDTISRHLGYGNSSIDFPFTGFLKVQINPENHEISINNRKSGITLTEEMWSELVQNCFNVLNQIAVEFCKSISVRNMFEETLTSKGETLVEKFPDGKQREPLQELVYIKQTEMLQELKDILKWEVISYLTETSRQKKWDLSEVLCEGEYFCEAVLGTDFAQVIEKFVDRLERRNLMKYANEAFLNSVKLENIFSLIKAEIQHEDVD